MQTITKYLTLLVLCFIVQLINAQDPIKKPINHKRIEALKAFKETIKQQEKDFLKAEVEVINSQLNKGEITTETAEKLKKEAAVKRALNIENRIAIVDNKISLYQRNIYPENKDADAEKENKIGLMVSNRTFSIKGNKREPKYDVRTSNDLLFAMGFNNAIIDGENLSDSPYKKGASTFIELGWNWKTRLFKNSPFVKFKYGFSFQWNKLNLDSNGYFVQNGNITTIETFTAALKKAKFRTTNLVFPVHFEFGPLKKIERSDDRIRYINNRQFKIGVGAYGGVNVGTLQKLKYNENGDRVKEKIKRNYNTSDFVYGLSGYIGVGDLALYLKYDLSPIFKNQAVKQNNVSLGIRVDLD
ncbi:hypothetical protein ACFSQS_09085 [Gelatiniphilus marinus]|uniref:Outer membrane protein beta-barrel domain-containing protein n=2 Tax=Gelatiniphilus marinus TaxID=1759464 RepID=A0ABW5JT88_9FLAO